MASPQSLLISFFGLCCKAPHGFRIWLEQPWVFHRVLLMFMGLDSWGWMLEYAWFDSTISDMVIVMIIIEQYQSLNIQTSWISIIHQDMHIFIKFLFHTFISLLLPSPPTRVSPWRWLRRHHSKDVKRIQQCYVHRPYFQTSLNIQYMHTYCISNILFIYI